MKEKHIKDSRIINIALVIIVQFYRTFREIFDYHLRKLRNCRCRNAAIFLAVSTFVQRRLKFPLFTVLNMV